MWNTYDYKIGDKLCITSNRYFPMYRNVIHIENSKNTKKLYLSNNWTLKINLSIKYVVPQLCSILDETSISWLYIQKNN